MPVGINVDDETERRLNCGTIKSVAKQGELDFQKIEEFATLVNVTGDGNCGYRALIAALEHIKKKSKETVKEIRRDIWEFAMNRNRYAASKEIDFERIYGEGMIYIGRVGSKYWMNTVEMGPIIAELYDVVLYVYWLNDNNAKKTIAYRPDHSQEHHDGGYVSIFKTDNRDGDSVVRLFCEHGSHFQWLSWGTVVKTEPAGGDRQVRDLAEDIEGTDPVGYAGEEEETEAENTVVVVKG